MQSQGQDRSGVSGQKPPAVVHIIELPVILHRLVGVLHTFAVLCPVKYVCVVANRRPQEEQAQELGKIEVPLVVNVNLWAVNQAWSGEARRRVGADGERRGVLASEGKPILRFRLFGDACKEYFASGCRKGARREPYPLPHGMEGLHVVKTV